MADARKCLQGLGKNPKAPDVHHITSRAAPFVEAFKKHQRVASNLISSEARVAQPKKKAKSKGAPPEKASAVA
ncbi:unnamed protein product [Symbiodinium necroappetens]|uniref:Uncharacterized protein n=1 Tax=Symbiodinium necroappetens TaxID=1628268 RepID=A0A812RIS1_9DINO|nr:unnamed protein product [Symbiodinium necroappetens]